MKRIVALLAIMGLVCGMDLTPNILIFAPVFYPLIQQAGIDPYYFGLLFVLNLGIGVITPPVGTVLYVVCGIGNIKITDLIVKLLPFILVETIMWRNRPPPIRLQTYACARAWAWAPARAPSVPCAPWHRLWNTKYPLNFRPQTTCAAFCRNAGAGCARPFGA